MHIKPFIQLIRPEQWVKNLFVFLPMFFNGQLCNTPILISCTIAFVAFSLAASSVYCFNDIFDANSDKQHPKKSKRPIASGVISPKTAYTIMSICLIMSVGILFFFEKEIRLTLLGLIGFYFVMNIAYSVRLKHFAIIDVMIISIGFVLRIFVGKVAAGVWLSEWIVIMTFLLALFLAFAKRRDDVILYQNTGISPRKNTDQ
jgi:4-hydroxybenzoate polyprenyltransferase